MKRNLLLASGILFALFLILRDQSKFEAKQTGGDNGNARTEEVAPVGETVPMVEPTKHLATEVEDEDLARASAPALALEKVAEVPMYFPRAKVVARVSEPAGEEGQRRVIETVETSMRERFVRVERVISPLSDGSQHVTSEVAMVANQLMLHKPAGIASYMFLDLLGQAGAVHVRELGDDTYLATFEAQPSDPRALEANVAKVQELAGVELTVEPNYIRKIF